MKKTLIFDFDGTLVDTEKLQYEAFKEILGRYGVNLVSFEEFTKIYTGTGSKHIISSEINKTAVKVDIEKAIKDKDEIYLNLCKSKGVKLIEGVNEFVLKAHHLNYKMVIASGSSEKDVREVAVIAKLPQVFEKIIGADKYKEPKPNPEVFLIAAHELGANPIDCIVFEDALNGVEAAKEAKMDCYAVSKLIPENEFRRIYDKVNVVVNFKEVDFI